MLVFLVTTCTAERYQSSSGFNKTGERKSTFAAADVAVLCAWTSKRCKGFWMVEGG